MCCSQCGLCAVDGETCVLFSVWFVCCRWGDMCVVLIVVCVL